MQEMIAELKEIQKTFPDAHIRYNAETDLHFICYFSSNYYSSLLIN
jgi:hypothetical protein